MKPTIRNPIRIRAGAVAVPGTSSASGDRKMATRNNTPVVTDVNPVRPPSATPAELSM